MNIVHIDKNEETKQIVKLTLSGSDSKLFEPNDISEITENTDLIILNSKIIISDIKKLKKTTLTKETPIIVLTEDNNPFTKMQAFDLDVFDYITMPFDVLEVSSRIRSVMRKINKDETAHLLNYKNICLNLNNHTVTVEDKTVELTIKEFKILYILLKNKHNVVTKEQLFREVWQIENGHKTRTLDMHITSLRQKLGATGKCIKTIRSVGYII